MLTMLYKMHNGLVLNLIWKSSLGTTKFFFLLCEDRWPQVGIFFKKEAFNRKNI